MVELCLLADPENAKRQETHKISEEFWGKRAQSAQHGSLKSIVPNGNMEQSIQCRLFSAYRNAQVKHEQGHRDGEDAIGEGGKALHALACDTVVRCVVHLLEFPLTDILDFPLLINCLCNIYF